MVVRLEQLHIIGSISQEKNRNGKIKFLTFVLGFYLSYSIIAQVQFTVQIEPLIINDGTQSIASNQIFKVYINKVTLAVEEITLVGDNIYNILVYPNPAEGLFLIDLFIPNTDLHFIEVHDMRGRLIKEMEINKPIGRQTLELDLSGISSGEYILSIKSNNHFSEKKY